MIQLDEYFRIEPDVNNFTLRFEMKDVDKKTNKEITRRNEWFCTDLKHALSAYLRESTRLDIMSYKPNEDGLEKLLNKLQEINNKLDEFRKKN